MRFPWLQVDTDFIAARSKDLASLLAVSRREALGIAIDLWMWVLGRASETMPPNGFVMGANAPRLIAGAVEWAGDPGLLIEALEGSGLASWEREGVRLRGFDRYMRTWEKNLRRKTEKPDKTAPEASTGKKPAESSGKPATILPQDADADAETTSASQEPEAVPERPQLKLEAQPARRERKPRTPSPAETLFDALQGMRKERCAEVGEPFVEERWDFGRRNKFLKPVAEGSPGDKDAFEAAWLAYLADDGERVREPAWSLSYFMNAGVRAKYETRAARDAA